MLGDPRRGVDYPFLIDGFINIFSMWYEETNIYAMWYEETNIYCVFPFTMPGQGDELIT
jgi:hypothetical protein